MGTRRFWRAITSIWRGGWITTRGVRRRFCCLGVWGIIWRRWSREEADAARRRQRGGRGEGRGAGGGGGGGGGGRAGGRGGGGGGGGRGLGGGINTTSVVDTAYFAHSAQIVAKAAAILGKAEDAAKYDKLFRDIVAA